MPESAVEPVTLRTTAVWGAENLAALREANGKLVSIGRIVGNDCTDESCP